MKIILMLAMLTPLLLIGCSSSKATTYTKQKREVTVKPGDKISDAEKALYLIKRRCEGGKPGLPPNIQLPCIGKDCPDQGLPEDGTIAVLCNARGVVYDAVADLKMIPLPRGLEVDSAVFINGKTVFKHNDAAMDVKDAGIVCQTVMKVAETKKKMAMATCKDFEEIETLEDLSKWCLAQLTTEDPLEPTPKGVTVMRRRLGEVSTCRAGNVPPEGEVPDCPTCPGETPTETAPCEGDACGPDTCQGSEDCEAAQPLPPIEEPVGGPDVCQGDPNCEAGSVQPTPEKPETVVIWCESLSDKVLAETNCCNGSVKPTPANCFTDKP